MMGSDADKGKDLWLGRNGKEREADSEDEPVEIPKAGAKTPKENSNQTDETDRSYAPPKDRLNVEDTRSPDDFEMVTPGEVPAPLVEKPITVPEKDREGHYEPKDRLRNSEEQKRMPPRKIPGKNKKVAPAKNNQQKQPIKQ